MDGMFENVYGNNWEARRYLLNWGKSNYTNAKTLVMFCNGIWCGQSPNNILNLLKFGYPAHKIKWYRGGMQDWEILGLTTVPGN